MSVLVCDRPEADPGILQGGWGLVVFERQVRGNYWGYCRPGRAEAAGVFPYPGLTPDM